MSGQTEIALHVEEELRPTYDREIRDGFERGEFHWEGFVSFVEAVLCNGCGWPGRREGVKLFTGFDGSQASEQTLSSAQAEEIAAKRGRERERGIAQQRNREHSSSQRNRDRNGARERCDAVEQRQRDRKREGSSRAAKERSQASEMGERDRRRDGEREIAGKRNWIRSADEKKK